MKKSPLLALLFAIAIPAMSTAAPHTLSPQQLTEGSLLGQVTSTPQLQREFATETSLLARASDGLGLSRADFAAVKQAVAEGHVRYVLVPRHLDGMAGQHGNVPFVDHDVVIPANVYGWEVDLKKPDGIVRVFVPNTCGNLSYLRVPKQYYVAAAPHHPHRVAAYHIAPVPLPTIAAVAPATPSPVPVAIATTAPLPVPSMAPVAAASHHVGWWPVLLVPLIFAFSGHGSSSSPAAPTPIHTICPTAITIRI
jgi:hypothetical protein